MAFINRLKKYVKYGFPILCIFFLFLKYCEYKTIYNRSQEETNVLYKQTKDAYKTFQEYKKTADEKIAKAQADKLESEKETLDLVERKKVLESQVVHSNIMYYEELNKHNVSRETLLEEHKKKDVLIVNLKESVSVDEAIINHKDRQISDLKQLNDLNSGLYTKCSEALLKSISLNEVYKKNKPRKKWFVFGPGVTVGYNGNVSFGVSVVLNLVGF